ncbi:lipoyl(octanoyl) transferase LipB [Gleimia sp. 6138-11-ORH1]|uniref:lipoyl(octanoyl) transferase LipB n=1 Tax=Gleimia sp. 6138-11-ORH1 TaxID=2973937 RepID=UPI002167533C|nr:lipoyl(octanoyl) transferase LipB [Gleimia sp. 6138-11-ORH1]MCS4485161.1 lipoyl(octanoyl) transferase LipB [Gleimia sp. 6138-11-ORH1]
MRVLNLLPNGHVPYLEGDRIQRETFQQVKDREVDDTLIVVEFESTYTAGRRTKPEDICNTNLPVIEVDRGGSVTWHGPGQLVIYPIVRLKEPVDRIKYIRAVEAAVVEAIKETWQLPVEIVEGRAGVWLRHPDRKICAIGLKVAQNTTMHGLALNLYPDFQNAFTGIIPCGIDDAGVTSLQEEGIETTLEEAMYALVKKLETHLQPLLWETTKNNATTHPIGGEN